MDGNLSIVKKRINETKRVSDVKFRTQPNKFYSQENAAEHLEADRPRAKVLTKSWFFLEENAERRG
jgi:hypothetical protein